MWTIIFERRSIIYIRGQWRDSWNFQKFLKWIIKRAVADALFAFKTNNFWCSTFRCGEYEKKKMFIFRNNRILCCMCVEEALSASCVFNISYEYISPHADNELFQIFGFHLCAYGRSLWNNKSWKNEKFPFYVCVCDGAVVQTRQWGIKNSISACMWSIFLIKRVIDTHSDRQKWRRAVVVVINKK